MAQTGNVTQPIGSTGLTFRLLWTITPDAPNNRSTVVLEMWIAGTSSAGLNVGARTGATLTVDGVVNTFSTGSFSSPGATWSWQIKKITTTVNHNADGTKTIDLAGYYPIAATLSGTYYASLSISKTGLVLDRIAVPSQPTLSTTTPTMGDAITIYTHRTNTAYTHTLKYAFGAQNGTIVTNLPTDHVWTVPLTLANAIPNAGSGSGTITCETYNGATLIGTRTVAFTATIPASVIPTFGLVNISEAVAGLAAQFLAYVQTKSKLTVVTAASGAYSSTITQIKVTIDEKNYIGSSITSDVITTAGTLTVSVELTDSRGRKATSTTNVTVLAYAPPTIAGISTYRVNSSGIAQDDGTSVAIPMNFTIASANDKNTKAWTLEYRINGATLWTALASGSVYTYNATYTNLTGLFDINNSYDIRLTLTDYFTTIERTVTLNTSFAIFNLNPSGKGIAFGKISERDSFEVGMPAYFEDAIYNLNGVRIDINKKTLYDNASGSAETITLSETAANFAYLDIYTIDNDGVAYFTRVHSPNGKRAVVGGAVVTASGNMYLKVGLIDISGTSVSWAANYHSANAADNAILYTGSTSGTFQKITRIDGWIA